jgi:flavin reductase (DIM6/NTAB) family NADH-FMN oxidoreductase RutF
MPKIKIANYPMVSPSPIVIVGTTVGGKPNYITVGAFGVVCLEPVFYISLKDTHYSTAGIKESGFFSVNLPAADMAVKTDYCGLVSGHDTDKSGLFEVFYDQAGPAPLIADAPLNYLCKVIDTFLIKGFTMFFGEIISAYAGEEYMQGGKPDPQKINPIIGMGMSYYGLGNPAGKVFSAGNALKQE